MSKPSVPCLFPGSTVVCIASGPSLTQEDVDYVRGKAPVVVVNSSFKMAPWADVLYASDARWWGWYKGVPEFAGLKFCLEAQAKKWPGVKVLKNAGSAGLADSPGSLKNGRNSGYAAINVAVHLGASRVLLLGYDMGTGPKGKEHWHDDHPNRSRSDYQMFARNFDSLIEPLAKRGVEVVNCTRTTRLRCFPQMPIEVALPIAMPEAVSA